MSKTKPERVVVPPSEDMEAFREVLRSSKRIIAIAGAGLSAASGLSSEESESLEMLTYSFDTPLGIPTFRGAGGMWRKYDSTSLATPEAFNESPSRVWQFYHYRREKYVCLGTYMGYLPCVPTSMLEHSGHSQMGHTWLWYNSHLNRSVIRLPGVHIHTHHPERRRSQSTRLGQLYLNP